MNWTMPYPCRSRSDSVRRINMSSEPGNESFFCGLRPIPRILSLQGRITRIKFEAPFSRKHRESPGIGLAISCIEDSCRSESTTSTALNSADLQHDVNTSKLDYMEVRYQFP